MPSNYVANWGTWFIDPANDSQLYPRRWGGLFGSPNFLQRSAVSNQTFLRIFVFASINLQLTLTDWNPNDNKVEAVGAGCGVGSSSLPGPASSQGGGGGGYGWADNINPSWPQTMTTGSTFPTGNPSSAVCLSATGPSGGAGGNGTTGGSAAGAAGTPNGYPGGNGGGGGGGGGGSAGPSGPGGDASGTTGGTANGGTIAGASTGLVWPIAGFNAPPFSGGGVMLGGGNNGLANTTTPNPALGYGGGVGGSSWPSGQFGPTGGPGLGSGGGSIAICTYAPLPPKLIQRSFVTA